MHGSRFSADRSDCGLRAERCAGLRVDRRRRAHAARVRRLGRTANRFDSDGEILRKALVRAHHPGYPRGRRQDGTRARPHYRSAARLRRRAPRERIGFLEEQQRPGHQARRFGRTARRMGPYARPGAGHAARARASRTGSDAGDMVDELAHALFPQGSFLGPFLNATAIYGIRYVLLAGIAFFAGYAMRREGKLQSAMPRGAQIRREIGYSAMTVLVFGLVIGAISGYGIAPYTLVYLDVARYGWAYFWLSIALVILAHDAYFYWTHRLMHTPALFRIFHGVHH